MLDAAARRPESGRRGRRWERPRRSHAIVRAPREGALGGAPLPLDPAQGAGRFTTGGGVTAGVGAGGGAGWGCGAGRLAGNVENPPHSQRTRHSQTIGAGPGEKLTGLVNVPEPRTGAATSVTVKDGSPS
jgi:hypothetical protein